MDKYYPEGDKDDSSAVFGYAAAETLTQVLRQCGDDLSRTNIMRQAASLVNSHSSVLQCGWCSSMGARGCRLGGCSIQHSLEVRIPEFSPGR
jgi:hypothetical protein